MRISRAGRGSKGLTTAATRSSAAFTHNQPVHPLSIRILTICVSTSLCGSPFSLSVGGGPGGVRTREAALRLSWLALNASSPAPPYWPGLGRVRCHRTWSGCIPHHLALSRKSWTEKAASFSSHTLCAS
jgi:hypothetical protein